MKEVTPRIRTRAIVAFVFFLIWGAFIVVVILTLLVFPDWAQIGGVELIVLILGLPALIALHVGVCFGLLAWRVGLIWVLLLSTAAVVTLTIIAYAPERMRVPEIVLNVTFGVYGLVVVGTSIWGLVSLRREKP